MEPQPGIFFRNALLVGVAAAASAVTFAAGVLMVDLQALYINTGTDAFGTTQRSFNWWGLGIGFGLMVGGITGLLGLVLRGRVS